MINDEVLDKEQTAPTERIKKLLREKGITQQEIADAFGKSLINIKKTLNSPSMTTSNLKRYADLLGVPMWELFASRDEVIGDADFLAMVRRKGAFYHADSLEELENLINAWKSGN